MMKRNLLLLVIVLLAAAAIITYAVMTAKKTQSVETPAATTPAPATKITFNHKTPQQELDEIVDCAALMAVHEANSKGELKPDSTTFELITYGLGKGQELAKQLGMQSGSVRTLYDKQTLAYFLAYSADAKAAISKNSAKVVTCENSLQQYEPNAQIQSTINKAREMAKEPAQAR